MQDPHTAFGHAPAQPQVADDLLEQDLCIGRAARSCPLVLRPQVYGMLLILSVLIALAASPALGWEFTPHPLCTLSHEGAEATVELTYDPREAEPYAITLTRRGALWPPGPVFTMTFEGARALTIGTDRHRISGGGARLTVTDRGFGNVLDGLEAGDRAVARLDDARVMVLLDGAAGPVAAFRACAVLPTS